MKLGRNQEDWTIAYVLSISIYEWQIRQNLKTKTDWTLPHKCHLHHQTEEHHQQQLLITPASNSLCNRPEVTQPHNLRPRVRVCLPEVQMGTEEVLVVQMDPTGTGPLTEEAVQAVLKSAPLCRCRSSPFEDWQTADVIRRNWLVGQIIFIDKCRSDLCWSDKTRVTININLIYFWLRKQSL